MNRKFKGIIEVDVRNSTEDWGAFTQPTPPKDAPNVVIILWDDTGIASWDFCGGLIKMPNMLRIADEGLLYTQFHTTALCSPMRAFPWAFTGGTIKKVLVDVSGEPYIDLEMEALAATKRD